MKIFKITDLITQTTLDATSGLASFPVLEYSRRHIDVQLPLNGPKNSSSILVSGVFEKSDKTTEEFNFICKMESVTPLEGFNRVRLALIQYDKIAWDRYLTQQDETQNRLDRLLQTLKGFDE